MFYPGDVVSFLLPLSTASGAAANVVTPPQISILGADGQPVDLAGAGIKTDAMVLIAGTDAIYRYEWTTTGSVPDGVYVAVVSYVANGITANGRFLSTVQLGDSRVTSVVASALATAKTVDLPNKSTVMLKTDFVAPSADAAVQTILAKVNGMPANLASQDTVLEIKALVKDVNDAEMGNWVIDKTVNPNRMTLYKVDGSILQSFLLTRNESASSRTRS